jgi:environmental stress-induced protein Ves
MAELIKFAQLPAREWKNGGGSTTEIVCGPAGADLERFDWRISVASIAQDGPFSIFDGVDRTISLLSGAGVELALKNGQQVNLSDGEPSFSFEGELSIYARLIGSTSIDFNVMTRRSRCCHQFERNRFAGQRDGQRHGGATLLFLARGELAQVQCGSYLISLQQYDSVLLDSSDANQWQAMAEQEVELFVVEICACMS